MNREMRKVQKVKSRVDLLKSKAFVSVSWDGEKMPIFRHDVTRCNDENDIRHVVMQECAAVVEDICKKGYEALCRFNIGLKEAQKVQEYKENRSKELTMESVV